MLSLQFSFIQVNRSQNNAISLLFRKCLSLEILTSDVNLTMFLELKNVSWCQTIIFFIALIAANSD